MISSLNYVLASSFLDINCTYVYNGIPPYEWDRLYDNFIKNNMNKTAKVTNNYYKVYLLWDACLALSLYSQGWGKVSKILILQLLLYPILLAT